MDLSRLAELASAEVERCYARADGRYRRPFDRPRLRFDLRGAAAGKAYGRFNLIRLNAALLTRGGPREVVATAAHEAAHLIAIAVHSPRRIRPHGREWASVMRLLGQPPTRTHAIDTAGLVRRQRRYGYTCACATDGADTYQLSAVRHHRIQRGGSYRCLRCRAPLRPAAVRDAASSTAATAASGSAL